MGMFDSFDINATGMTAQRFRMDIISQNVANANTTRTSDGTPYVRKVVTFTEKDTQTPFHHVLNEARDRYSGKGVKVNGRRYPHIDYCYISNFLSIFLSIRNRIYIL